MGKAKHQLPPTPYFTTHNATCNHVIPPKEMPDNETVCTLTPHGTMKQRKEEEHAIFDSGNTGHFLAPEAPYVNKRIATNPIHITLPDSS